MVGAPLFRGQELTFVQKPTLDELLDEIKYKDLKRCHYCKVTFRIWRGEMRSDPASQFIICQDCIDRDDCTGCEFRKAMGNPITGKSLKKYGYYGKCTKAGGPEACNPRQGNHRRR